MAKSGRSCPGLTSGIPRHHPKASAHSYAAGEGVNREVTQSDLETLLGGFIPQVLGWEGFDQLSGMLAFRTGARRPLGHAVLGSLLCRLRLG